MRKTFFHVMLVILALLCPITIWAQQATYYVSTTGDDSNPGTLSSPFKTITKARDVVRTINGNMTGDIIVYLRGGTYYITETIKFTEADGGTNDKRVYYQAYNNETPVISGGVPVAGWTQHSGNIWKADLNRAGKLRHLYVNDKRAYMASKAVSATGGYGSYSITQGQADWAWKSGSTYDGIKYNLNDLALVNNPSYVEINDHSTWNTNTVCVRGIITDGSSRVALLQQPYGAIAFDQPSGAGLSSSGQQYLRNAYEWLDEPGEFYFDDPANVVYYYKRTTDDMSAAEVYAPNAVETLIRIQGTSNSSRVKQLTFQGITFAHADYMLQEVDGSCGKATPQGDSVGIAYYGGANSDFHGLHYRAFDVLNGAIMVENAEQVIFQNNIVKHGGSYGIGYINDIVNSHMYGNTIYDMAGSGIVVGHPQHLYIGDGTTENKEKYAPGVEGVSVNTDIKNNLIYDTTTLFWGHAGITAYFVEDLDIQHNHIEKSNFAGISLGWGWGDFDGTSDSVYPDNPTNVAKNNNISFNKIIDTNIRLTDCGAIYTLGQQPNSTMEGNYIFNVGTGHNSRGWHSDQGTAYFTTKDWVIDIIDGFKSIDFGFWGSPGNKHDNRADNVFSRSKTYVLEEPNSTITNYHYVGNGAWPTEAQNIINNAGLESSYQHLFNNVPTSSIIKINN